MNYGKVVTRFAPSPTGFIHVGNVRTALFAFLQARHAGGTFILRIEDTDKVREVSGSIERITESLRWLGIDWDEGPGKPGPHAPYLQSERLDTYLKYAWELVEKGHAYPDPYTKEEVEMFRKKAETDKRPFLYREHRPTTFADWDGKGALRFKVPEIKRYHWHDAVRGDLEAGEEALDDYVLMKGDGYPTYNFAHIVDDVLMGVTHIMRGEEFISSTPRFLSLYEALGLTPPIFATLPPILRDDRTKKLGKRDGAKDILDYREEGFLPEPMVNYLATLGWAPQGSGSDGGELFSMTDLIRLFDISKVQKAGAAWNEDKLLWLNKEYLKRLPAETALNSVMIRFKQTGIEPPRDVLVRALPTLLERISVWSDLDVLIDRGDLTYLVREPNVSSELLGTIKHLGKVRELLEPVEDWSVDSIKAAVWDFASTTGRADVLAPMRIALSGLQKSPDPFMLAYILGKEETLKRLGLAQENKRNI